MQDEDDPGRWLGDTPIQKLGNDKLRLRVHTVTQFSRTPLEKLLNLLRYVESMPFGIALFGSMKGARVALAHRKPVGWFSKAALFVAMLRVSGFSARIRMIRVGFRMYRGLAGDNGDFVLPVAEVWTGHRWAAVDTYVYDPPYLAAAREAVQRSGWPSGYGVHLDGQTNWDGVNDALTMIVPDRRSGALPPEFLGVYDDPAGFADEMKRQSRMQWLQMLADNRLMSVRIHAGVRALRREAGG